MPAGGHLRFRHECVCLIYRLRIRQVQPIRVVTQKRNCLFVVTCEALAVLLISVLV